MCQLNKLSLLFETLYSQFELKKETDKKYSISQCQAVYDILECKNNFLKINKLPVKHVFENHFSFFLLMVIKLQNKVFQ